MGVWIINNGVDSTRFNVSLSAGGKVEAVTRASDCSNPAYTVKCACHTHRTNRSLKKVTAQIECVFII